MQDVLKAQLPYTLKEADFPRLGQLYRGKVRDNYAKGDRIVMITTDRLSAFDRVLTTVPVQGRAPQSPDHLLVREDEGRGAEPHPRRARSLVLVVRKLQPLAVEMVVRGYITGSLWRDYEAGRGAKAYGIDLPEGMRRDQKFDRAILTPSTKEEVGKHDEPISPEELVARGTLTKKQWEAMARMTLDLFAAGQSWAQERGLILVDTKYEFGTDASGKIWVIDEIHTPDSSRYWIAEGSEERFRRGEDQKMLDKEFVRQWLIRERNYKGEGRSRRSPTRCACSSPRSYAELVQTLTGEAPPLVAGDTRARIEKALAARGYL